MTTTKSRPKASSYMPEGVDRLPFGSEERERRYRTDRYAGATGRNWYTADPSLQFLMRYYMDDRDLAWAEPHLVRLGALIGGPISERAEQTDKDPPRLIRYDKWGHEISQVVLPESLVRAREDMIARGLTAPKIREEAQRTGVNMAAALAAASYMLCQADIGLSCALGTGGGMIQTLVDQFAPPDVRNWLMPRIAAGELRGGTAQLLTERTGGSDLAQMETTAVRDGDAWRLNGLKWFASNADGEAYVVLAKPVGARDDIYGVCSFLVLRQRRDGSRNGIRIRQLKDKLGTRSVASAEVEFIDAEAFLLAPESEGDGVGDGKGASRMMAMTNGARVGVAMMGLGCARRALVESICYAGAREAFGRRVIDHPLMRRKLAEMIVDVEAAQALVFDSHTMANRQRRGEVRPLRIGAPVVKLRAARLGITMASDAIEVHGGNGYVETWPVARILRDAQVNTIWEGTDNILCLDIRRGIEKEEADGPFIQRLSEAVDNAGETSPAVRRVAEEVENLRDAIEAWKRLDRTTGEARLFPLASFMGDVYAAALLVEQAEWERRVHGSERKALVAKLFVRRYLEPRGRLRGIEAPDDDALDRFDELLSGAFTDELSAAG